MLSILSGISYAILNTVFKTKKHKKIKVDTSNIVEDEGDMAAPLDPSIFEAMDEAEKIDEVQKQSEYEFYIWISSYINKFFKASVSEYGGGYSYRAWLGSFKFVAINRYKGVFWWGLSNNQSSFYRISQTIKVRLKHI